eukprot:gene17275-biopygen8318
MSLGTGALGFPGLSRYWTVAAGGGGGWAWLGISQPQEDCRLLLPRGAGPCPAPTGHAALPGIQEALAAPIPGAPGEVGRSASWRPGHDPAPLWNT